jgi:hypothetical protein
VKRALQPQPLRDFIASPMPFLSRHPLSSIFIAVVLVFTASSCHKKVVAVPVPSQPAPQPAAEAPAAPVTPAEPVVTPPPATTPAPIQTQPAKDESKYQKNKPPEQPPPPKRTTRPLTPAPATQAEPATAAPVEPPRLGDILTPDQQHQYNSAIDVRLAHAQASLNYITTRQLTKEQEATVAQVQNFMAQAQEKRKDDLAAANSLAERAEVLSHDLVASLRK